MVSIRVDLLWEEHTILVPIENFLLLACATTTAFTP